MIGCTDLPGLALGLGPSLPGAGFDTLDQAFGCRCWSREAWQMLGTTGCCSGRLPAACLLHLLHTARTVTVSPSHVRLRAASPVL